MIGTKLCPGCDQADVLQRVADKNAGSKLHTGCNYIRGFVLVRIEHMYGYLHTLVTQPDEKPSLDVALALIHSGSLRH